MAKNPIHGEEINYERILSWIIRLDDSEQQVVINIWCGAVLQFGFNIETDNAKHVVSEISNYIEELGIGADMFGILSITVSDDGIEFLTTNADEADFSAQWFSLCRLLGILLRRNGAERALPNTEPSGWTVPDGLSIA